MLGEHWPPEGRRQLTCLFAPRQVDANGRRRRGKPRYGLAESPPPFAPPQTRTLPPSPPPEAAIKPNWPQAKRRRRRLLFGLVLVVCVFVCGGGGGQRVEFATRLGAAASASSCRQLATAGEAAADAAQPLQLKFQAERRRKFRTSAAGRQNWQRLPQEANLTATTGKCSLSLSLFLVVAPQLLSRGGRTRCSFKWQISSSSCLLVQI